MCDRGGEIRSRGADLVIVGNGAPHFAVALREDFNLDGPLFVDPELKAYRAAGLRRGLVEVLSPCLPLNAVRALRNGVQQRSVQGDPWQLGGVFVVRPGGELTYRYISSEGGHHPPPHVILQALSAGARAIH